MNDSCRASYNCGGQVAFVFRLPAGQVEFSGLFLTLREGLRVGLLPSACPHRGAYTRAVKNEKLLSRPSP